MRAYPLSILINKDFKIDKKFYFISGNEVTLMEKIKDSIIKRLKENQNIKTSNINNVEDFIDENNLFEDKKICLVKGCKGVNVTSIEGLKDSKNIFIFIEENSQKLKKIKKIFLNDKDSFLIDCYELEKDARIKVLNEFLNVNKIKISQEIFWLLIDKLDNKYIFFENSLNKLKELSQNDITIENAKKILTINDRGKDKIFLSLLNKNKDITKLYRSKIVTISDVNDFYYYSKFFCQLIIENDNEEKYGEKIPIYLFKEKKILIDIYKKYNLKKRKMLLRLLSSTDKILRKESGLSLISGLRFLLNVKKITVS